MYYKLNQNVLTSLDSLKCTYHLQDILYNSGLYFLKKQFIVDRGWWDVKSRSQVSYLTALSRLLAIHSTISKPFSSKLWTGKFESFRILFFGFRWKINEEAFLVLTAAAILFLTISKKRNSKILWILWSWMRSWIKIEVKIAKHTLLLTHPAFQLSNLDLSKESFCLKVDYVLPACLLASRKLKT